MGTGVALTLESPAKLSRQPRAVSQKNKKEQERTRKNKKEQHGDEGQIVGMVLHNI